MMTQMWLEISEQPKALENCMLQNKDTLEAIVTKLKEKDIQNVIIAARGTSDHAAVYAKYLIETKLGIPVALAAPSVFTLYNKSLVMKNSLVIGVSQSGRAEDVIEVIKSAKAQGAPTVAITNHDDSPLAQQAEFHLYCATGVEKSVAATKTFTAQIYLLAHLVAFWSQDEAFKKELAEVPSLIAKTIAGVDQIKNKVARYRFMSECFVLARGANYSIALESALKVQETCYIRAKAYATSDFHHGPFAMIDDHMPVLIYAPKGESLKDITEMIGKLKNAGADLLIVSNDAATLALADCAIEIPDVDNDFITPFMNVVIGQMFACNLSVLRGLNPDSPRGLSKVTITR